MGSLPFLSGYAQLPISSPQTWSQWLSQLVSVCPIESVSIASAGTLPAPLPVVISGEFSQAENRVYFYEQQQYCFRVFEKTHPMVGTLDLMIPFWQRQATGTWEKIACWSLFELQALSEAAAQLGTTTFATLIPFKASKTGQYLSAKGEVHLQSYLYSNNHIATNILLKKDTHTLWESRPLS
ncbi:MAG TPA: hypothetical protein DCM71_11505 [Runella sp.]|nr:hypothetical protein [Runella sp.]